MRSTFNSCCFSSIRFPFYYTKLCRYRYKTSTYIWKRLNCHNPFSMFQPGVDTVYAAIKFLFSNIFMLSVTMSTLAFAYIHFQLSAPWTYVRNSPLVFYRILNVSYSCKNYIKYSNALKIPERYDSKFKEWLRARTIHSIFFFYSFHAICVTIAWDNVYSLCCLEYNIKVQNCARAQRI